MTVKRPAPDHAPRAAWRRRLYRVIWESDTPAGRLFDQVVVVAILVSVAVVLVDSVHAGSTGMREAFTVLEWFFTALFTLEYVARLVSVERPLRYAASFFGIVDLLAVLPTYLALFLPELHVLIDVRILRLLRVFRIFRLTAYVTEYQMMGEALWASRRKILVFLAAVVMIDLVMGTLMYVVEGPEHGFTDIPTSVYWALLGWGTLAVPTGIVTAEMALRNQTRALLLPRTCAGCGATGYGPEANYCQQCGKPLPPVG